jgi:hypothetical protein
MEHEVNKEKAIRLDNSTLFDIHKLSEYKEVDNCVAYLFDILAIKIDKFKHVKQSPLSKIRETVLLSSD